MALNAEKCEQYRDDMTKIIEKKLSFKVFMIVTSIFSGLFIAAITLLVSTAIMSSSNVAKIDALIKSKEQADNNIVKRLDRHELKLDSIIEKIHDREYSFGGLYSKGQNNEKTDINTVHSSTN